MLEAAVVYGYYPVVSEGDDLVLLAEPAVDARSASLHLPAAAPRSAPVPRRLLPPRESGEVDVLGLQLVTVGSRIAEVTSDLFAQDAYRDYLELHGLSVS
jgi:5-methyltetrahydrofolate--homocysteine methyltransferase